MPKLVVPMPKGDRTRVDIQSMVAGLGKLGEAKEGIARAMGVAMGVEVRDEAIIRAPLGTEEGGSITPGLLRSAMFVAYDDRYNVLNPNGYRYQVSWNSKKAPHGHLVEFGHWMPYEYIKTDEGEYWTPKPLRPNPAAGYDGFWVEQRAFLGPAFDAKLPRLSAIAFQAGTVKFAEVMK